MADPFELRRIVDDLCRKDFFAFAIRAFPILEPGKLYMAPHIAIICFLLMKVFEEMSGERLSASRRAI